MSEQDAAARLSCLGSAAQALDVKERTRLLYMHLAPVYGLLRPRNRVRPIVDLLDIHPGQSLLDCGMGPGVYALRLARSHLDTQVYGVDFCDKFVKIARKRAAKKRLTNVLFTVGDLEDLDFDDDTFDRLVCVRALSLVDKKVTAAKELARVLKTDGRAVFAEPLKGVFPWKDLGYLFWLPSIKVLSLCFPELRHSGRREYGGEYFTVSSLRDVLTQGGFSVMQTNNSISLLTAVCRKHPIH